MFEAILPSGRSLSPSVAGGAPPGRDGQVLAIAFVAYLRHAMTGTQTGKYATGYRGIIQSGP